MFKTVITAMAIGLVCLSCLQGAQGQKAMERQLADPASVDNQLKDAIAKTSIAASRQYAFSARFALSVSHSGRPPTICIAHVNYGTLPALQAGNEGDNDRVVITGKTGSPGWRVKLEGPTKCTGVLDKLVDNWQHIYSRPDGILLTDDGTFKIMGPTRIIDDNSAETVVETLVNNTPAKKPFMVGNWLDEERNVFTVSKKDGRLIRRVAYRKPLKTPIDRAVFTSKGAEVQYGAIDGLCCLPRWRTETIDVTASNMAFSFILWVEILRVAEQ